MNGAKTNAEREHTRQVSRERHARKKAEWADRRKVLGMWLGFTCDAQKALNDMDRCDKELASLGVILLCFVAMVFSVSAQTLYVVTDTNQLGLIPSGVKITAMTNLTVSQTFTQVTTNWSMVGPPFDVKDSNGVVTARRIYQVSNLMTNKYRVYDDTNYVLLSQAMGPVMETRHYDIPPPLPSTLVTIPLRQQR